jgi:asparagine synthase (glutamine-hydrolysing)
MCGITGIYCESDLPQQRELEAMVHSIRRRGPDDRGYFVSGPVGLGMSRLSIIDPENGRQPISSEDGNVVVVCNGEIYNHPELRRELGAKGHRYKTRSDAETLVHLYEEEGLDFLDRLQGMFGLALWDQKRHRLIIARDRLGIKPVYYTTSADLLIFGSELKAVVASKRLSLTVDNSAIDAYFKLGYVPNPLTIYREVKKLPPAHVLIHENGQTRLKKYWNLSFEPKPAKSASEWQEQFVSLFQATVEKHLMSDVPLGAFLSGGVDSSFVVATMAGLMDKPVKSFTVGFAGSKGGYLDERDIAREVSRQFGTEHTEFEVQPRPEEIIDEVVEAFDEPFADDSVIPTYYLCRETSKQVKVALSGLGGDELFAGYERYLGLVLSSSYDKLPGFVKTSIIGPLVNRLPELKNGHYTINHLKRFVRSSKFPPAERYQSYVSIFGGEERRSLLPGLNGFANGDVNLEYFSNSRMGLLDQALNQDIHTYLPEDILALSDRLSMWHSLELRVPFVDHQLVEFCAAMPASLKIRGREKKVMLRRAARGVLPDAVLNHRKQGFAAPMAAWLRGDLKEYVADSLSTSMVARHGLLDPKYVHGLLHEHWTRRELNDRKIFSVLMFQRWLDTAVAA